MTRSDAGTIVLIYAVCILFLYMTLQLKPAAQIYPLALIGGLALLDTLYLGKCLIRMKKNGQFTLVNDLGQIFKGFLPGQFFFVLSACIAYIVALFYLGFYLSSLIYLLVVMLFLKVRQWQMWLTIAVLGLMVYCVFTLFLKVPLPKGLIFG